MGTYVNTNNVYSQIGPLAEITTPFTSLFVQCTSGDIIVIVNGASFSLSSIVPILNEGFIGKTFEVTGTGTWHGFLRGDN